MRLLKHCLNISSRLLSRLCRGEAYLARELKLLPLLLLAVGAVAQAQSPTYGLGRTPTAEEVAAWDIAISPDGKELPAGSGTVAEGEQLYMLKTCFVCHGQNGAGASAPRLIKRDVGEVDDPWDFGRVLPIRSPYATTVWDYINRGMPLGMEGTLTADEVYSLTAYLLFINDVIAEDTVLDQDNLPKIEMPNRNNFARVPDWFSGQPRLEGYPY